MRRGPRARPSDDDPYDIRKFSAEPLYKTVPSAPRICENTIPLCRVPARYPTRYRRLTMAFTDADAAYVADLIDAEGY